LFFRFSVVCLFYLDIYTSLIHLSPSLSIIYGTQIQTTKSVSHIEENKRIHGLFIDQREYVNTSMPLYAARGRHTQTHALQSTRVHDSDSIFSNPCVDDQVASNPHLLVLFSKQGTSTTTTVVNQQHTMRIKTN
jgi:hypothetical protein